MTRPAAHVAGAPDRPTAPLRQRGDAGSSRQEHWHGWKLRPHREACVGSSWCDLDVRPPATPGGTPGPAEPDATTSRVARELSTVLSRAWGGRW